MQFAFLFDRNRRVRFLRAAVSNLANYRALARYYSYNTDIACDYPVPEYITESFRNPNRIISTVSSASH